MALSITGITGQIDVCESDAGTYTVFYNTSDGTIYD